ncbi:peptide-methionine (S)-S-oxide reductase MsrA [Litorimonas sp. RW-G-Af-16]|uniref:peptide-methionine (S)-S-oxide reductase MsrA n=1 Tax=Litorimonas sp. RW-G-Af-16 TaxID=3241168 RepID=UPI00390C41B7
MKNYILPTVLFLAACSSASTSEAQRSDAESATPVQLSGQKSEAIVAGGCFWCVESDFEKLPGVYEAISGYSGGDMQNPTYRRHGQHLEVAKIIFDPTIISYEEILDHYWRTVDPTDPNGQFCDRGNAYKTAIYATPEQMDIAIASKNEIAKSKPFDGPIVTPVLPAKTFWTAEDYHQDYYKKNPIRYKYYRNGCGRDARIKELWGEG